MSLSPLGLPNFKYSVKDYAIQVDVNPKTAKYHANVHITLYPDKSTTSVSFFLHKQCTVAAVNYLGLPLPFQQRRSRRQQEIQTVSAKLPRRIRQGEKLVIHIIYNGLLRNSTREVIQLAPEDFWYPFAPGHQYTSSVKISLPDSARIAASGIPEEEKSVNTRFQSHWLSSTPTRGLHIIAGQFNHSKQQAITAYYPRPLLNQARMVSRQGPVINQLYDDLLGITSIPHTHVVLTDSEIASCTSSYTVAIGPGQLDRSRCQKNPGQRTLVFFAHLARELARKRLRCHLATTVPAQTWYLEGLAQYCSWLAVEQEFGKEQKMRMMLAARQSVLNDAPGALASLGGGFGCRFPASALAKAAWIMHMVHQLVGEGFFPAVRECQERHQGIVPAPRDFFLCIGEETSTDLSSFYREWVETAPKLELVLNNPRTFLDDQGQWQLLFCLVNRGKLKWPLPVDIHLTMEDGKVEHHAICVREKPYLFSTPAKVVTAVVDRNHHLLNWAEQNSYNL